MQLTLQFSIKKILTVLFFSPLLLLSQAETHVFSVHKEIEDSSIQQNSNSLKSKIVEFPEVDAQFPGGSAAVRKYLHENIKYPTIALENGDQGKVFLSFVVNTDGSLEQIKVIRGVSKEIDHESIRFVKSMPNWIPAEIAGEKVRSRQRFSISFHTQ